MVRVPALQYHFISRILDVGAMGVVVPFVASEQQARRSSSHAKYPPEGRRGVAFGVAHDGYRGGNLVPKMRRANEEVMLIAQIENAEGVEHADQIAAVDGIDALWIGQFDLSTSLGIPGRFDHRFFQEATRKVVEACRSHGKIAVLGASTPKPCSRPGRWLSHARLPDRYLDLPARPAAMLRDRPKRVAHKAANTTNSLTVRQPAAYRWRGT